LQLFCNAKIIQKKKFILKDKKQVKKERWIILSMVPTTSEATCTQTTVSVFAGRAYILMCNDYASSPLS
jgi:hypothetical protein